MCQAGDLDGIRASTQIDWNFVYPPAYVDPDSGEKQLEAWCRTPLCLLVRPDEGNFDSKMSRVPEEERQALLHDPNPNPDPDPNPHPNPNRTPTLTLTPALTLSLAPT